MMTRAAQALFVALALLSANVAMAADYAAPAVTERRVLVDDARLPPCFSPKVFNEIADSFESKERTYWHSGLVLLAFAEPRELGYRSWGPEFIPRRFCAADTRLNDGSQRTVFYSIGKDTGTLGVKWGVEWCVTGVDRNLAFAPNCRMAQP
ncbi:hypothetical protein [Terrihabitans sp. B22-R8]|uniref:hypothetical protein n=1 Tax=Terrihabitans sp. B22-R8 TaxID=3425128 RepID=UPI00403C7E92